MKVEQTCAAAQRAGRVLAGLPRARKDGALAAVAEALERRAAEILAENAEDVRLARENRLPDAMVDRLLLDDDRLRDAVASVRAVAALPDPVGQVVDGWRLENGVDLRKVRVPLGVVAVIYEARPNVTVDAACLCIKTGNAVILRGGSAAKHSNRILAEVVQGAVIEAGLPREAISYLSPDRRELEELLKQRRYVDLVIPRGGEDLKDFLLEHSKVPVIYAAGGNCHVYVDAAADLDKATRIMVNAKCQRPGVCNAAETLLVHSQVAAEFLPRAVDELKRRGVELVVDKAAADVLGDLITEAREQDPLRDGIPLPQAGGASRGVAGRGPRAHRHLRDASLRGHRHGGPRRGAAVQRRGGRGLRLRQRVDPLHRRRAVRPGRRDGHLDAEAARPRAHRTAGAHHREVRALG